MERKDIKPLELEDLRMLVPKVAKWEQALLKLRSMPKVNQPKNVTPQFLHHQLGACGHGRVTPTTLNPEMDQKCGRTLLQSRTGSLEGAEVMPFELGLPLEPGQEQNLNQGETGDWARISVNVFGNVRLNIVDSYFWTCCLKPGDPDDSLLCLLQFYTFLPASPFRFKVVASFTIRGRIVKVEHLKYQDPNTKKNYNYFVLLNRQNQLLAIDLDRKQITNDLILLNGEEHEVLPTFYSGFEICHESRQVLVLKTNITDKLKGVLILSFPPNWSTVAIVHVDTLPMDFYINYGHCFIVRNSSHVIVASWERVFEQATQTPIISPTPSEDLIVVGEWEIYQLPPQAITITPQKLASPKFGVLNIKPMLLHTRYENGLRFYLLDHNAPAYECHGVTYCTNDNQYLISEFPDGSPRILLANTKLHADLVLTFSTDNNGLVRGVRSYPFDEKTMHSVVLDMDYCKSLNLLGVLFGEGGTFYVKLYEPATLKIIKSLPIVRRVETGHLNPDRIFAPSLLFHPEYLIVELYFVDFNDQALREVYCGRLFGEDLMEPLL